MKKIEYIFAVLLIVFGAVSCKKNSDISSSATVDEEAKATIFLKVSQGGTKTTLNNSTGALLWQSTDKLGIYTTDYASNATLDLIDGAGTTAATFSGVISQSAIGKNYYGFYPADKWTYVGGKGFLYTIPEVQQYKENSLEDGIFPSIGTGTASSMSLKNPFAVFRITVKSNAKAKRVELFNVYAPQGVINGQYYVDPNTLAITLPESAPKRDSYKVENGDGYIDLSNDGTKINFVVPAWDLSSVSVPFQFIVTRADGSKFQLTDTYLKKPNIKRAEVYESTVPQSIVMDPCGEAVSDMGSLTVSCGGQQQTYRTCTIGSQVWFAENYHCNVYASESEASGTIGTSTTAKTAPYYYDGTSTGVGYYYNWAAAVGNSDGAASPSSTRQGICPNGWRLPTKSDFAALKNTVISDGVSTSAAYHLRGQSTGWKDKDDWEYPDTDNYIDNNPDCYGFKAFPNGYCSGTTVDDDFLHIGMFGPYASFQFINNESSNSGAGLVFVMKQWDGTQFDYRYDTNYYTTSKAAGVRCIKK